MPEQTTIAPSKIASPDPLAWFHKARYGLFIHWGAYSVAARGEWALNRELIPYDEYTEKYVNTFRAEKYDPSAWARLAVDAGMKYAVLTTRHHDGFALWDTETTEFNAARRGPKRDLVRPYVEAMRAAGLKVGLYYSFADWHHPDYPNAYARDWPDDWASPEAKARFQVYYRAQLTELMTQYGRIDILWYDGCLPSPGDGDAVNTHVKSLQPHILINDRNGSPWDIQVCEQAINPAPAGVAWEACMTLNDNWGYHAGDRDYKNPRAVVKMLTETAKNSGNLLLNIGPMADGTIPAESEAILREVGAWLERNGEFLPNSTRSPFSWNLFGKVTTRENFVYLHLFHSPGSELCLAEIANPVLSVTMLATGAPVAFEQDGDRLFLRGLPVPLPDPIATTIVFEVEGKPSPLRPQTTFWIPG